MVKKRLALIFIVCGLLMLTGCEVEVNSQPVVDKTIETARTRIWQEIGSANLSSASLAIMKNGKIIYEEGFAMADRLSSRPVDTSSQFNIGSVSKVFTATAILQLVEAGKLELDQTVVNYLEDFTMADERYQNITVRMLLNHTSGLPGTYMVNGFASENDPEYLNHFINYLKISSLKSDPGTISVYCNDGFTLAEVLIERVSGLSYADYLEENIFSPAGMADSSCCFVEDNSNIALNYRENGLANPVEYVNLKGSGGITSTPADLCRFGDALTQHKLLSADSLLEGISPQYGTKTVPMGTPITNYGLGWDMVEVPEFSLKDIRVVSKNGATLGFSSQFYLIPEEDLSIALIFSGSADVTELTNDILTAFLEENQVIGQEAQVTPPLMAAMPAELIEFAGYYGGSGSILKIDFDPLENQMIYQEYDGRGFVETNRFVYMNDGFFQNDQGLKRCFSHEAGKKLMLGSLAEGDYFLVLGEEISPGSFLETAAWANKDWIPINLSTIDLFTQVITTRAVDEIPGIIAKGESGSYTAYDLKEASQTQMILEYARDLASGKIINKSGLEILELGGYRYKDVTKISKMKNKETIKIDGDNSLRFLDYPGKIEIKPLENSRILVFGPDYTILYDSLIEQGDPIEVVPGSIISLIGERGMVFEITYTF